MLVGPQKNIFLLRYIDYKCPQRYMQGECTKRFQIRKLPPVLILHLKNLDNFAKNMKNEVKFLLVNFSQTSHVTPSANSPASYNLYGVINHHDTPDAGH